MMRIAIPSPVGHAPRGVCTAMRCPLCRACAAMNAGIAVQASEAFTGGCAACTAMCRALPYSRTHTGAYVRTQESSSAQWDVSRYSAAHAVQNAPPSPRHPPTTFPPAGTRLAHVASFAPGRSVGRLAPPSHTVRLARGAIVADTDPPAIGTSRPTPAGDGRGNGDRFRQTFFREKGTTPCSRT